MNSPSKLRLIVQRSGLVLGPLVAALLYAVLPAEYESAAGGAVKFSATGHATLALMLWMAIWWLTEAVEITVTALLPLALFPLCGVADMEAAAAPYANPLIFLFMGGFLLAISMQHWGLGKRIALMTLQVVGVQPRRMVAGFMLATAVLSAFVSNTATTAMMLPIAISLIALLQNQTVKGGKESSANSNLGDNFSVCLLLGIAYAASIGGVATIIGSPPNVFLVGFVSDTIDPQFRSEVTFAKWLLVGVPLAVVFLPIVWFLLTRVLYPIRIQEIPGGQELIRSELKQLGRPKRAEWVTWGVFTLAAILWMTQPLISEWTATWGALSFKPFTGLTDPGIAMIAALLLFVIPSGSDKQPFVMTWENARQLPFGILILFGGGLSLAAAVKENGVAEFIGAQATWLQNAPPWIIIVGVTAGIIFMTELTSNTATTATLVPVLAALAPGLGMHPYVLIFPAAIAASCAFMLPIATPPNAIVFGSGRITILQMAKVGLWLNLIAVGLITGLTFAVIMPLFGGLAGP